VPGPARERSRALFERARRVLVGGVNSPVRAFKAVGGAPLFVQRADGPFIHDADGNRYVDLVGSWGPAIVGHAHPEVLDAVRRAAAMGLSFGAPAAAEVELAEEILAALPGCDLVRFVSSGTEAVMSAVRLARAATRRDGIVKFQGCYHGHADALLVAAGSGAAAQPDSAGVPRAAVQHTRVAPYNDLGAVGRIVAADPPAAILVEPVAGNMGLVEPRPGFLEGLRALCDGCGALLILDEVMTGFRVAWGGMHGRGPVRGDIVCLGKVIGGGMPVGAYAARRELMDQVSPSGPMYQAGTLSGNPVAMAAGLATLRLCRAEGFYRRLDDAARGLAEGLVERARGAGVALQGAAMGGMLGIFFAGGPVRDFDGARGADAGRFARFFHAMLERGVWLPPSPFEAMFLSSAHGGAEIDHVLGAAAESFAACA
jgi:glutamate-1-semialdehyde 2,1-aminomutase